MQPNTTNTTQHDSTQHDSTQHNTTQLEPVIWAMFYANLVAMHEHPGQKQPRSLITQANAADIMLDHWRARWRPTNRALKEKVPCL